MTNLGEKIDKIFKENESFIDEEWSDEKGVILDLTNAQKILKEIESLEQELKAEIKRLTELNSGLSELTQGMDYCAEESDKKAKLAESRLAKAQELLKILPRCNDEKHPEACYADEKYGNECKYCSDPYTCTAPILLKDLESALGSDE